MAKLTFGKQLKKLREEKGLSQDYLAETSGVKVRAIRTYEQEQRAPSAENLFKLSKALGVECSEFKGCGFDYDSQRGKNEKPKSKARNKLSGQ